MKTYKLWIDDPYPILKYVKGIIEFFGIKTLHNIMVSCVVVAENEKNARQLAYMAADNYSEDVWLDEDEVICIEINQDIEYVLHVDRMNT